jgi:hypothetical protein
MQLEVCAIVMIYLSSGEKHEYVPWRSQEKGKLCTYSFTMAVPIFEHFELCPYFAVFGFHLVHLEGCMYDIKIRYCLERRMY